MFTTLLKTQEQARSTQHIDGVGFVCSQCHQEKPVQTSDGTGYGYDKNDNMICYSCCGENESKELQTNLKGYLYFCGDVVSNWPNTLSFNVQGRSYSWHNFAGKNGRVDFWFTAFGKHWHGVCIGRDNQLARVKALKGTK